MFFAGEDLPVVRAALNSLLGEYSLPRYLSDRARIVAAMLASGGSVAAAVRQSGFVRNTVRKWWRRFCEFGAKLGLRHCVFEFVYEGLRHCLRDAPRSGAPDTYSATQVCEIIALALRKPEDFDLPVTHWTAAELADQVRGQGIAPTISDRTVGRILQKVDIKPQRFAYWLNPKITDEQQFHEEVETLCKLYKQAPSMGALDMRVVSTDEKTGIQALSRIADDIPARPGHPQRLEFEYRRNGTVSLIPSFDVVTGKIIEFTVHETRDELTFAELVRRTVQGGAPETTWIFVLDQLNTHKSETLVRMVDELCGLNAGLGEKGKDGILATLASREAFLRDSSHRIRFVYTPKHCSWLNQVEIWFGIITRKLLRRGNFSSTEQLKTSIGQFIDYYNRTMAKPFKWTYEGKALRA